MKSSVGIQQVPSRFEEYAGQARDPALRRYGQYHNHIDPVCRPWQGCRSGINVRIIPVRVTGPRPNSALMKLANSWVPRGNSASHVTGANDANTRLGLR